MPPIDQLDPLTDCLLFFLKIKTNQKIYSRTRNISSKIFLKFISNIQKKTFISFYFDKYTSVNRNQNTDLETKLGPQIPVS